MHRAQRRLPSRGRTDMAGEARPLLIRPSNSCERSGGCLATPSCLRAFVCGAFRSHEGANTKLFASLFKLFEGRIYNSNRVADQPGSRRTGRLCSTPNASSNTLKARMMLLAPCATA